jgi:hypothetical protein
MRARSKLETPWNRRALIIELAQGNKTQSQLAGEFGCIQASISEFKARHLEEIQAVQANSLDELTGIAIARKAARLEAYQEILDKITVPVPRTTGKGEVVRDDKGEIIYEFDANAAAKILRQVAEEVGQLPSRIMVSGEVTVRTNYTLNGVDPNNLR